MIINENACDVSFSVWTTTEAAFVGWIGNWLRIIPIKMGRKPVIAGMIAVNSTIFDSAG